MGSYRSVEFLGLVEICHGGRGTLKVTASPHPLLVLVSVPFTMERVTYSLAFSFMTVCVFETMIQAKPSHL